MQPNINTDIKNKHRSVHGRYDDRHVSNSPFACMFCFLSVGALRRGMFSEVCRSKFERNRIMQANRSI